MKTVTSKDGTTIAFDQSGQDPALILVHGATAHRALDPQAAQLAELLAPHFTVFHYDRRGRGDSGDTQPYAIQREVEDIEALIDEAGGSAFVYGISSGAALAMEAAVQLDGKIRKLAIYEAPYNSEDSARQAWKEYRRQLKQALAEDRRGDALALFLTLVGMPLDQINEMRKEPWWSAFEVVAPTLAYDAAIMGEDRSVPVERAASVPVPALVISGDDANYGFMRDTAMALAKAMPNAQYRTLEGQTHDVAPEVLAPVLIEFFNGSDEVKPKKSSHLKVSAKGK
jgi:pimeloyl-ACP methyl ester carboxylesterase